MAVFTTGQQVVTNDPHVDVTVTPAAPLPPGKHRFQLIVVDDAGNASDPTFADIVVVDDKKPTAVIDAPATVPLGVSFSLSGARSSDVAPGKVVEFRWTRLT
jgi:hypothetical protein